MPRNSWASLQEETASDTSSQEAASTLLPESLVALQRERAELEARMRRLASGGAEPNGNADARFPVTPLALRRRADAAWASRRDAQTNRSGGRELTEVREATSELPGEDPLLPLRTGQRLLGDPPMRSGLREPGHSWDDTDALDQYVGRVTGPRDEAERRGRESLETVFPTTPTRAYEARRERLLSLVEGGCGDLDERAERARELALARRRWQQREQQADDRRLTRARRQRQAQEDE